MYQMRNIIYKYLHTHLLAITFRDCKSITANVMCTAFSSVCAVFHHIWTFSMFLWM